MIWQNYIVTISIITTNHLIAIILCEHIGLIFAIAPWTKWRFRLLFWRLWNWRVYWESFINSFHFRIHCWWSSHLCLLNCWICLLVKSDLNSISINITWAIICIKPNFCINIQMSSISRFSITGSMRRDLLSLSAFTLMLTLMMLVIPCQQVTDILLHCLLLSWACFTLVPFFRRHATPHYLTSLCGWVRSLLDLWN